MKEKFFIILNEEHKNIVEKSIKTLPTMERHVLANKYGLLFFKKKAINSKGRLLSKTKRHFFETLAYVLAAQKIEKL